MSEHTPWTAETCRNCAGSNLVCENHPDRPWDGNSNSEEACGCGAGKQCPVCESNGHFEAENRSLKAYKARIFDAFPELLQIAEELVEWADSDAPVDLMLLAIRAKRIADQFTNSQAKTET